MSLDSIVSVTITRETKIPSQQGFGTGAFVSETAGFQERVKLYASATEISEDSFAGATTLAFGNKYFGQTIRPEALYVIKKGEDLDHIQTITFDADFVTGNSIALDVDGNSIGPVPFDTDHATTIGNLATAIAAEAGVDTAVVGGPSNRVITVTGANVNTLVVLANLAVTGGASQAAGTIATTQWPDESLTYVESLTDAEDINNEWYAIAIESRLAADILAVQAYTEPRTKIFFATSNDADVLTSVTTDICSDLQALSTERTSYLWSDNQTNWPEAAWMGGQLPNDPGSITWANKTLIGVAADDLKGSEISNLDNKNANYYTNINGISTVKNGKMAGGEFIDVIRGADFIAVRIQEAVFTLLSNAPKVPFTNKGIGMVENEVRAVLDLAVDNGIITDDYVLTVPDASEVPLANKGTRVLPDISFVATLQGAIHKVQVEGVLQL